MKTKKTVGFYLTVVVAVLALVGLFLYPKVMERDSKVTVFLVITLLLACAAVALALMGNKIANPLGALAAVTFMAAIGFSAAPMVMPIGLWYAGLYDASTVNGYFTFVPVTCIGWLVAVVSSFMGLVKKA